MHGVDSLNGPERAGAAAPTAPAGRRVRVCYFNRWAGRLEAAADYVARAPAIDLRPLVSDPADTSLLVKARLDCDWFAENARCFDGMKRDGISFLPAWTCGQPGLLELAKATRAAGEERWLILMGQQPKALGQVAGKTLALLGRAGVRRLYYAFDEASRTVPGFAEIAAQLDVLIHDESPLEPAGAAALRPGALVVHRSWVANVPPFSTAFEAAPEPRIVFLGSQLGLTPHRQRQIDFLRTRFGDRFVAISDHSVPVAERHLLARRFQVSVCPEGRKFGTAAMRATHTDRPFWSGCLGLVPVSEDSAGGGRLEALHRAGLILRYAHGDLEALAAACTRALALPVAERRRIYEHFNRHETVGTVVAEAIAAAVPR